MDDKTLRKIDQLLAQMQQALGEIRQALPIVTREADKHVRSSGILRAALRSQVAAARDYMSGRWVRRDGNIFGITAQNDAQVAADADRPPRNIRPTD